ncbi:MAG: hypothetical protein JWL65_5719 [Gammaproteobacteria bacterium]|nr:hypothetical protein [Gammaproteobacteria bacterium]
MASVSIGSSNTARALFSGIRHGSASDSTMIRDLAHAESNEAPEFVVRDNTRFSRLGAVMMGSGVAAGFTSIYRGHHRVLYCKCRRLTSSRDAQTTSK